MVNTGGQLYTIEGVAAGLIMLVTAYLVVGATSVYTPGDAHISDMQLEVLGSDALTMMDTPPNSSVPESPLQQIIETDDGGRFRNMFLNYTNVSGYGPKHDIQFSASYTYEALDGATIISAPINSTRNLTGGEHAVRATRWVIVNKRLPPLPAGSPENRAVLVEVLLWRD
ncbi:MAG: hypothetical protein LUQ71_06080 [Methanoregula sp.]|jgi:hypothetical protein|nr:hypothetical protein [Methanoregula sp.]